MNASQKSIRWVGVVTVSVMTIGMAGCGTSNVIAREPAVPAADEQPEALASGSILYTVQAINQGEIQLAELALQHSENAVVGEIARLILEDHVASNERLDELAEAVGARFEENSLSEGVAFQAQAFREDIAELTGEEFNLAFLQKQVVLHEVAKDVVRTQLLPDADEPRVREYLSRYYDLLELHRQRAQAAYQELL